MSAWTPPDVNGRSPPYLGYFSKTVVVDGSMMPQAIFLPFLSWITTVRPSTSSFARPVFTSLDSTFDGLEVYLTDTPASQRGEPAGSSQLVPPQGYTRLRRVSTGLGLSVATEPAHIHDHILHAIICLLVCRLHAVVPSPRRLRAGITSTGQNCRDASC